MHTVYIIIKARYDVALQTVSDYRTKKSWKTSNEWTKMHVEKKKGFLFLKMYCDLSKEWR